MNKKPVRKVLQGPLMYLLLLAVILLVVHMLTDGTAVQPKSINYSTLLEWVEADLRHSQGETLSENQKGMTLSTVVIQSSTLMGVTEESKATFDLTGNYDFTCVIPSESQFYNDVNAIYESVLGRKVSPTEYHFSITSKLPAQAAWWVEWVPLLITMLLFGALWYFLMRQQTGGGKGMMSFGKSRARMTDPNGNKVTFDDVAGAEEEKEELREIVQFLKNPQHFTKVGARIPTGVLLVGPPGTGKTLLARAVAGEAGVPFMSISGSDFVEMFVGVGASRVRDLFDQAKRRAPCIVFIDEIDAVGRRRGAGMGGGHDEREQTLNQLLVEMDGFAANEGVIVLAATNRKDILDPALLRPGRFDRQITVNYPDVKGREAILKVHAREKPLAEDVDLMAVARRTPYMSGADLENIMNEAAILCARAGESKIRQAHLSDAIERVQMGPEKRSHAVTEEDKRLVAYHEAGHAIVGELLPGCDRVHLVTIMPRGGSGGHTLLLPEKESDFTTKGQLTDFVCMALGGYAAESLVLGQVSTGASSDLQRATQICRNMITKYGMSDEMGPIYLETGHDEVFVAMEYGQERHVSEEVLSRVDREVQEKMNRALYEAREILEKNRDKLDGLAQLLIEKETIDRAEFERFMQGGAA